MIRSGRGSTRTAAARDRRQIVDVRDRTGGPPGSQDGPTRREHSPGAPPFRPVGDAAIFARNRLRNKAPPRGNERPKWELTKRMSAAECRDATATAC